MSVLGSSYVFFMFLSFPIISSKIKEPLGLRKYWKSDKGICTKEQIKTFHPVVSSLSLHLLLHYTYVCKFEEGKGIRFCIHCQILDLKWTRPSNEQTCSNGTLDMLCQEDLKI